MLITVYDIQNDKLRGQLSNFLKRFGRRIQYSVFEIKNSPRVIANIQTEINSNFQKKFGQSDSVLIFDIPDSANILKFGYPLNEDKDLLFIEKSNKKGREDDNSLIL